MAIPELRSDATRRSVALSDRAVRDHRHPRGARGNVQHDVGERARPDLDVVRAVVDAHGYPAFERGGDSRGDRLRRVVRRHMEVSHRLVGAGAARTETRDAGDRRAAEQGPVRGVSNALHQHDVGRIEPDDAALMHEHAVSDGRRDEAATARDDHRLGPPDHLLHRREFDLAECTLAVLREDRGGGASGCGRDLVVEIDRGPAKALGQQRRDGALSGSRQSHERDPGDADHRRRRTARRCAAAARRKSGTLSPPNFSSAAAASTHASIASATTAPAGTTQTSLRS